MLVLLDCTTEIARTVEEMTHLGAKWAEQSEGLVGLTLDIQRQKSVVLRWRGSAKEFPSRSYINLGDESLIEFTLRLSDEALRLLFDCENRRRTRSAPREEGVHAADAAASDRGGPRRRGAGQGLRLLAARRHRRRR